MIQNVSDASAEQNEAIRQIMQGLQDIDKAVDSNRSLAQQTSTTAQELKDNAVKLMGVVNLVKQELEDDNYL